MSNTPSNPFDPQQPPPLTSKGPWLYSGGAQPTPSYMPPAPSPPPPQASTSTPPKPTAAPAAPPTHPPAASKPEEDASLAGIIDTIEAVIIALILALSFRAFVVEAFVIPTGSMAPTLLGAHFNVVCDNCGYAFPRNASLQYQRDNLGERPIVDAGPHAELVSNRTVPSDGGCGNDRGPCPLLCPNCQHIIPFDKLPQALPPEMISEDGLLKPRKIYDPRTGSNREVPFAWANNGDRILVLKYIYSFIDPKRFDVIVFKEPMNVKDNYIKRLIGLPGETVEIIGGDIFITPPNANTNDLTQRVIARKPPHIQKYLWQLIYDNDYYPLDENQQRVRQEGHGNVPAEFFLWRNPWRGAGPTAEAWYNAHKNGVASIGGPEVHYTADAPGKLEFVPRDPYTYNILGYNNDIMDLTAAAGYRFQSLFPVGDLHLETVWTPVESQGTSIRMAVGPPRNLFCVTWSEKGIALERHNVATGSFEPVKIDTLVSVAPPPPLKAGQAYHVELNNVDRSVQFFIDGRMVLEHLTTWTAADARAEALDIQDSAKKAMDSQDPTKLEGFMPVIAIEVGGRCTLSHLKLMRDLYYTQSDSSRPTTANMFHPLTLGPDEFFALGDNSRSSLDGRGWDVVSPALDDLGTRRGIVPRRYLLGKAFFVYWPAGHRLTHLDIDVPLVPNTGEMRFIR